LDSWALSALASKLIVESVTGINLTVENSKSCGNPLLLVLKSHAMRTFPISLAALLTLGCFSSCSDGKTGTTNAAGNSSVAGSVSGGTSAVGGAGASGANAGGVATGGTSSGAAGSNAAGTSTSGAGGAGAGNSAGGGASGGSSGAALGEPCANHGDCAAGLVCVGAQNCGSLGGHCLTAATGCGGNRCGWTQCQADQGQADQGQGQAPASCSLCYDCGSGVGCLEQDGCYACVPMP
jgi:hypothetical protein